MELHYGIDDVNLVIYDRFDTDKAVLSELSFKNHKEFSIFTKVLMRSGITFEVVSYNRLHHELENAVVLEKS